MGFKHKDKMCCVLAVLQALCRSVSHCSVFTLDSCPAVAGVQGEAEVDQLVQIQTVSPPHPVPPALDGSLAAFCWLFQCSHIGELTDFYVDEVKGMSTLVLTK